MKTFFTADTHFWHKNVIEYCNRPWSTVEEMNHGLITNWNTIVCPEDTVWVLGDFAFCGSQKLTEITKALNGTKNLIIGNHDWKNFKPHRYKELGFNLAAESHHLQIPELGYVQLNHFPFLFDHKGITPRYMDKRPKNDGQYLFHGHIHNGEGSWKVKHKEVNVGVDVWDYRPITIQDILKEMGR